MLIVRTNSWAAGHGGTSSVLKPMAASGAHVKALGLMIPQAFLLRACEVIETPYHLWAVQPSRRIFPHSKPVSATAVSQNDVGPNTRRSSHRPVR